MKRFLVTCVFTGLVAAGTACAADPEPKAADSAPKAADSGFKTDDEKTFYALGLAISNQLSTFRLTPAELEIVKSGLTDGVLKNPAKVELDTFGPKIKPLAESRQAAGAAEERKKGTAFLETIAAKPKIKKTESGLLMETIAEGTGASPVPTDKVKVTYKGTLIDGTMFDGSEKHGGSATFALNAVVKCWTEGLGLMKPGGKAKLYCPADLGWGDRGSGLIPPGATTLFEVELLEIVKPDQPAEKPK